MPMRLLLLSSLSALALACSEYEITKEKDGEIVDLSDGTPDIEVTPTAVDFGSVSVEVAAPPAAESAAITIGNVGEGDLHIQDIYLEDETGPYTIGAISSVLVQTGGTATFNVSFTPLTAVATPGRVLIESDDPDEAVVEVLLNGSGVAPVIEISPVEYDFGTLFIGCDGEQPITIKNVGNADLVVTGFEFNTASADDIAFDDNSGANGALPWTLAPGATKEVTVAYEPHDEYSDIAYLFVDSNDPFTPSVMATQEGLGALSGSNLDLYEQPIKGMTDIVFAVDKSCSMDDDIANVQNNFGTFVTTMAGLDADYHVIATVEDSGCINGSDLYIDNTFSASDAQSTLTTMINLGGSYAGNTERGFMLLEAFLAESIDSSGCNWGAIREDATLNLVGVSDEPEQSVNNYAYYVSAFQSLKANPDDVVFHAIGGDYPSGCSTASAYTNYYEAVTATGGLFLSICATDWGAHLEALAEGSTSDLSTFELTDWPVPTTIVVRIDGVTSTTGWEYNGTDNAIDFEDDYVPEGGSTIEIEYALYGDCDG